MFDTEKFINAVEARPTIWKNDETTYGNRVCRRQAWEEVAQELTDSWHTYTERQRDDIIDELQKKWRNLRDYHMKLRKKDKVMKRKANYLDLLHFLDKNMEPSSAKKRRNSDTDYDSDDNDRHRSHRGEPTYEVPMDTVLDSDFPSTMMNSVSNMNEDPDRSFLVSILPHIRSMTERQKFRFKLEAMKLIDKIIYSTHNKHIEQEEDCIKLPEKYDNIRPKIEIVDDFELNSNA